MNTAKLLPSAVAIALCVSSFASCNFSHKAVPFPADNEFYLATDPLKISDAIPVVFDSSQQRTVTPLVKKFDLNDLPSTVFDTLGYKPFLKQPEVTSFNWDALPAKDFDLSKIAAKPLTFKTSLLPDPGLRHVQRSGGAWVHTVTPKNAGLAPAFFLAVSPAQPGSHPPTVFF